MVNVIVPDHKGESHSAVYSHVDAVGCSGELFWDRVSSALSAKRERLLSRSLRGFGAMRAGRPRSRYALNGLTVFEGIGSDQNPTPEGRARLCHGRDQLYSLLFAAMG